MSKTAPSELELNREVPKSSATGNFLQDTLRKKLHWILIGLIGVAYLMSLTPGHALIPDDYAAYIMHAANIVEGRPYAEIKFVPNPDAMWISPPEGYPADLSTDVGACVQVLWRELPGDESSLGGLFRNLSDRIPAPDRSDRATLRPNLPVAGNRVSSFLPGSMGITFFPRCRT